MLWWEGEKAYGVGASHLLESASSGEDRGFTFEGSNRGGAKCVNNAFERTPLVLLLSCKALSTFVPDLRAQIELADHFREVETSHSHEGEAVDCNGTESAQSIEGPCRAARIGRFYLNFSYLSSERPNQQRSGLGEIAVPLKSTSGVH